LLPYFLRMILFVAAIPFFLVMASYYVDEWFNFPRFVRGTMNFIAAMPFIIAGLLFAIWAIGVQFSLGQRPFVVATFLFFALFPLILVLTPSAALLPIAFAVNGLRLENQRGKP